MKIEIYNLSWPDIVLRRLYCEIATCGQWIPCMTACSRFVVQDFFLIIIISPDLYLSWFTHEQNIPVVFSGLFITVFEQKYFQTIFNFDTSNGLIGRTELRLTGSNSTNDCQPWHQYFTFNNRLWWHFLQITCIYA